jgi:hypothetical protein
MLGWARCNYHKKPAGTHYAEVVFLHLVGYVGHVVHFSASGARNAPSLFFTVTWAPCGLHTKCIGTRYVELVLLHRVLSAGDVVHSSTSTDQNVDAIFLMLGWSQCGLHKKHAGTRYAEVVFFASGVIYGSHSAFRCVRGVKHRQTIFMLGGAGMDSIKSTQGHITSNLCF